MYQGIFNVCSGSKDGLFNMSTVSKEGHFNMSTGATSLYLTIKRVRSAAILLMAMFKTTHGSATKMVITLLFGQHTLIENEPNEHRGRKVVERRPDAMRKYIPPAPCRR